MKVLVVAYACAPGEGSEPGVGWATVQAASRAADEVWVVTRSNNERGIREALASAPLANVRWVFFDLPGWTRFWKRGALGARLYHGMWQRAAARPVSDTSERERIDVGHHATFASCASPSALRRSGVPYVWGPVGGGESSPAGLMPASPGARAYETARGLARAVAMRTSAVRETARNAGLALASTEETAAWLRKAGARDVAVRSQVVLDDATAAALAAVSGARRERTFVSVGRLLAWRAFDLAIEALAALDDPAARLEIVGDGPEQRRLEELAARLGVADRVSFPGWLPRRQTLEHLGTATALVYPSLHDSGGYAVAEAMAAGTPVVCLDAGGPGLLAGEGRGAAVSPGRRADVVAGLAEGMRAAIEGRAAAAALRARDHAREHLTVSALAAFLTQTYARLAGARP